MDVGFPIGLASYTAIERFCGPKCFAQFPVLTSSEKRIMHCARSFITDISSVV
jgi:hypothetical protein